MVLVYQECFEEEAEDLEEDDEQSRHEMFSVEGGNGSGRARAAESAEPLAIVVIFERGSAKLAAYLLERKRGLAPFSFKQVGG